MKYQVNCVKIWPFMVGGSTMQRLCKSADWVVLNFRVMAVEDAHWRQENIDEIIKRTLL